MLSASSALHLPAHLCLGNRAVWARLTHGTGAKPAIKGGGGYAALSWANTSDICRARLVVSGTRGGPGCRSRDRPPAAQPDRQGLGDERRQSDQPALFHA